MNKIARAGIGVFGAIVGLPIGSLIAFYAIRLLGPLVFGPEFFQIAWFFMMFALPGGAIIGALLGAITGALRPRWFAITFIPLGLLFLALETAQYHLRRVEEPRLFTLEITTETTLFPGGRAKGRNFIGKVKADGVLHKIEGPIPAKFTYNAVQLEYEITLADGKDDEYFSVEVTADEEHVHHITLGHKQKVIGSALTRGTGWWQRTGGGFSVEHVH